MSGVVAAVESVEFDLDDKTSMDSVPCHCVCLNDNYKKRQCQQVKKISSFIRTRNRNLSYWSNRQTRANNEQPRQQDRYQQRRSRRVGWSSHSRNLSSNSDLTSSFGVSENANRGGNNYATRSGPPPNNRPNVDNK